jgi:hypothetical protein
MCLIFSSDGGNEEHRENYGGEIFRKTAVGRMNKIWECRL